MNQLPAKAGTRNTKPASEGGSCPARAGEARDVWRHRASPKTEPPSSEKRSFLATGAAGACGHPLRRVDPDPRRSMFADTMSAAIDAARTLTRLDHLSRAIWQAHGARAVGDEAQALAEHLHAGRAFRAVIGEKRGAKGG